MMTTAIATSTSADPRSGWASTSTIGDAGDDPGERDVAVPLPQPPVGALREQHGEPDGERDLHQLRGLQGEATGQPDPRPRPVDRRPERRDDGHEPDDREHVDDGCERPHDAHVEPGEAQCARHADGDGEQLLERQPGAMGLAGRRPHEHDPDEREPGRADEEAEVEAQPRRARPPPVGAGGGQDGTMAERISRHRSTSCAICSTSASTPSKRRVGRSRSTNSTTTRSP